LNWNWDSSSWKTRNKILLLLATVWPVIYIFLFIVTIFSMFLFIPFAAKGSNQSCGYIDVLQLDRKIKDGDIKHLIVREDEIVATDRLGCDFEVTVTNENTRQEILKDAREVVNGRPRVEKIVEETSRLRGEPPAFIPIGFVGLVVVHMGTILLMMALMPLYIVLAVKNDRLDQTMRIIWVVLLCMMGMLANPVYWYLYVWRKPSAKPANDSSASSAGDNMRTV